ncbi:cadherin-related family member 5 isoform X1 [Danio rerio]|uniref:Cadherin-related family member 5 isoform X1 n=1 Tax=Danio rerio TaxID=7955 RepID=A0A8M6YYJ8_DANRE|nr:cadherin-related family member 5 isoform X1 [Danio rerio]|eukprot:XP_017209750.2 cadherin-related family member 5 isoform X1 [Danio rerio]
MDLRPKGAAVFIFLLVIFTFSKCSEAQDLCSVPLPFIFIKENNTIDALVTTINAAEGVTAVITGQNPPDLFDINDEYQLIAKTVMDYEKFDKDNPYLVNIECTKPGSTSTSLLLRIVLEDINDNPPSFKESWYSLEVKELTKVDTSVGLITATDPDESDRLYYRLESPEGEFDVETSFNPNILVKKLLDYDKVKQVTMTLYAQDTQIGSSAEVSHTATATVVVNIIDIDNRPPWFQPCTEYIFETSTVCINSGYNGVVTLKEQETDPLKLMPGPVYGIDGDAGIKELIGYTFMGGNEDGIFNINTDTGNITMLKPVDVVGPFVLTVMAFQKLNPDQFATTTVILKVALTASEFPPKFTKESYEGFISEDAGVDSLVLEGKTSNRALRVQATDEDFSNGYNPNLRFEIVDGTDFYITPEGFILMAKAVTPGTVNLEMRVIDTENDESSTASLVVEITPGVPTTTPVTTITTTDNTDSTQLTDITDTSHPSTHTTTHPGTYTTAHPNTGGQLGKAGDFTSGDMAAVGATLAVFVVICLVCIGLLAHRIKGHNAAWKKLSEASIFRSTLGGGSGGPKEGMQYINESFQNDGDTPDNSRFAADLENKLEPEQSGTSQEKITRSAFLQTNSKPPADSSSLADSENTDGEKEVKPILTKERRTDEGYKSVWFREDIDPDTKEEVVIIPDTGEADGDHEDDEDDDSEEDDEDDLRTDMDLEDDDRLTSM